MKAAKLLSMLAMGVALAFPGTALAGAKGSGFQVVPNTGMKYGELGARWWKWALSFPVSSNPIFDTTGEFCAQGQGQPWFLAGTSGPGAYERSCTIPKNREIFFPIWNTNNDYPCPDPSFAPAPGQSLKDFLTEGALQIDELAGDFAVSIDGVALTNLTSYKATSNLFTFKADPSMAV